MRKKCLVLNDREPIPENHLDDLAEHLEVAWYQRPGADFSLDEAVRAHPDAQVIITTYMDLRAEHLAQMGSLEAIIATTVSTHFIDAEHCRGRGIAIFNTAGYTGASVAEHAVALMMAAMRRIPAIDREVRAGNSDCFDYPGTELAGKTAGIIGFGNIGGYVARLLGGFAMQLQFYNRSPRATELARAVDLDQLLATSDIVFLTLPLNHDSHRIIDAQALRRMRPTALLVNISPDDVMDIPAVCAALESGEIGGAALDLLRPEPFLGLASTTLTTRRAWYTNECFARRIGMWKQTLSRWLDGERQQNLNDGDFVPVPQSR
jgi:lactate dehydrogenase-like 2-hydroxyacid dehydrogenase